MFFCSVPKMEGSTSMKFWNSSNTIGGSCLVVAISKNLSQEDRVSISPRIFFVFSICWNSCSKSFEVLFLLTKKYIPLFLRNSSSNLVFPTLRSPYMAITNSFFCDSSSKFLSSFSSSCRSTNFVIFTYWIIQWMNTIF